MTLLTMATMSASDLAGRIDAVRRFSRFYTRRIGVLHEGLLGSPFSLAEARIIYELAHHEAATAAELGAELGLDAGYLSRLLKGFEERGLITRRPSPTDGRQNVVALTEAGAAPFARPHARPRGRNAPPLEKNPP